MGIVAIGTVRGSEIVENKDADEKSRMLQVELTNPDDLQSIEQLGVTGEDSNPQPGARVIVIDLGPAYRIAVALSDELEPSVDAGEKELFSYDDASTKLATIKLLSDSSIEINGNADNAVAFADLKTAFDQLKADFDALVNAYNAHIHVTTATVGPTPTPGVIAVTVSTGALTTADIDPAKIDSIKVP
jgi:phage gp45-like